ncbi:pyruvate kinase [Duganella sp. FT134W]|uniref:pyruvate kinase n=1 Tax=Duganella margarita TaxID=2692170 RepID=A0A7X4H238_9BURK|nr:pyruvate kinase [Duganella margarita]MYM73923.1 pyruvate kinase [Duganella margarita]
MGEFDQREMAALEALVQELIELRAEIVDEAALQQPGIAAAHDNQRHGAANLAAYLALRRRDLRPLQHRLARMGLSSLGRAESHVLATVDAVLTMLHRALGRPWLPSPSVCGDFDQGSALLREQAEALLGSAAPERSVRIMVTMPAAAADDYQLVHQLLAAGAECLRINCAHDDAACWSRIIGHARRAGQALGRRCRIAMDLAGPKMRTGPVAAGPAVVKIRPVRDAYGRVTVKSRVWLAADSAPLPATAAAANLALPEAWLRRLRVGARVKLTDARGRGRSLTVVAVDAGGCWAEADRTMYLTSDTVLRYAGRHMRRKRSAVRLGTLPQAEGGIRLRKGDRLIVAPNITPGREAQPGQAGRPAAPAAIGCTLPQALEQVRPGDAIFFDDGKIGGVVNKVEAGFVQVLVTQAAPGGSVLRADKGINLPDSALQLAALTAKDLADLEFIAAHADIVQLSFANTADDVALLQRHLARLGRPQLPLVLKIETRRGFQNLPEMLLMALRSPVCGVMIARGDLAVECGFERLAEVQEEILWICEAAHVPVIWATQVLESLAQRGMPSRAEVTDAAMSDRAECVMLNKGPYVLDAVRMLDDILRRMQQHQSKKQSMLRSLRLAQWGSAGRSERPWAATH